MTADETNGKLDKLAALLAKAAAIESELDYPSMGGGNKKVVWLVFDHIRRAKKKLDNRWQEISK